MVMGKKTEFLYLSEDDVIKAGATSMRNIFLRQKSYGTIPKCTKCILTNIFSFLKKKDL